MPDRLRQRPAGPAPQEAVKLLGRVLARRFDDGVVARVRLVEVEAYEPHDPASHSFRGRTRRNATMFEGPGHLYVYLVYGVHWCLNVVTGPPGRGSAVLLRAAEPLEGLDAMRVRRPDAGDRDLCRGPGRLARALDLDGRSDGLDLYADAAVWLERGSPTRPERIVRGARIGISRGQEHAWRFAERESRFVSAGSVNPAAGSPP